MKKLLLAFASVILLICLCLCSCKSGTDGETPYIGENGNWWIGETDTGVNAEGDDGDDGDVPEIGENGNWWIGGLDTGITALGSDGKTPFIGENGNWWIGETDTGVLARFDGPVYCTHSFSSWKPGILADCTSMGYSSRVCSVCNYVEYLFSEALGHQWDDEYTYVLGTGDILFTCTTCGTVKLEGQRVVVSTVTPEELVEANDRKSLLLSEGNITVTDSGGTEYSLAYIDSVGYCATRTSEDGVTNVVDGAVYTVTDTEEIFLLIPDGDYEARGLCILLDDPLLYTPEGDVLEGPNSLIMVTSHTVTEGGSSVTYTYTSYFDKETLLLKRFTCASLDEEVSYTLSYDEQVYVDLSAYNTMTSGTDATEICFVVNPGDSEERERRYTVVNGAEFGIIPSEPEDTYGMFMNYGCTAAVEDLSALISEETYEFVYIYVSNNSSEINFNYTLTDEDTTEFEAICDGVTDACLANSDPYAIVLSLEKLVDKLTYFSWQSQVGQVLYGLNPTVNRAKYETSGSAYDDAYHAYIDCLKTVYDSDAEMAKSIVFSGWTAEDFEVFANDTTEVTELREANDILASDGYELIESYMSSGTWDYDELDGIYSQIVANYQLIADFYGYDNYYEYASAEVYSRDYTAQDRELFRGYVKEYIVPLYVQTYSRFNDLLSSINQNTYYLLSLYMLYPYAECNVDYIEQYIDTYDGQLGELMAQMLDSPGVIFDTEGESPFTAFVGYSMYYEQPYAFFSYDYQDMMTIVHEMGHFVSRVHLGSSELSMDVKEIHSQGNEWMYLLFLSEQLNSQLYEIISVYHLLNALDTVIHAALVDEFEERVYTAATPVTDYESIARELAEYYGGWDFLSSVSGMDPYMYIQYVASQNPLYYLSYATSSIASLGFYILGTEDYEAAQESYRVLQEDISEYNTFDEVIELVGLYSPFEEETYISLFELFYEVNE